ncbi:MAG TPA: hypothetical protein VEB68_00560 [Croceibacterium sp.]|nr:hypothetical protein [Croceibacterium sp.]
MKKYFALAAATTMALAAGQASAQATSNSPSEAIGAIFGALFGDRAGVTTSIETQWAAGQTPLANQRAQFESRVDSEISTGAVSQATGARLKSDYYELVQLEARYAADRRFTSRERTELADRYGALTQVLAERGYADNATSATAQVADGRVEFDSRVDAAVSARRITRAEGRRLKRDYSNLAGLEAGYLGDGALSSNERADLDARLAAIDARVGDATFAALTPRARLDAIGRALASTGLSRAARAQLQVEYDDLTRLESAYARLSVSADERAYLDRRLAELEARAGVRQAASGF